MILRIFGKVVSFFLLNTHECLGLIVAKPKPAAGADFFGFSALLIFMKKKPDCALTLTPNGPNFFDKIS